MQIEPLPKVTFLPKQLTELVIENWTGDIIDYEKNGQVSDPVLKIKTYTIVFNRSAMFTMGKAPVNSKMVMNTRVS